MIRIKFLLIFSLATLFLQCSAYKEPLIKKADTFKLAKFEGKKITFSINLEIENTNWYALKMKPSSVKLSIDEKFIGTLFLLEKIKAPAKKTSVVLVPVRLELEDKAFFSFMKYALKIKIPVRFEGKVKGGLFFIYKNFQLNKKVDVPGAFLNMEHFNLRGAFGLEK